MRTASAPLTALDEDDAADGVRLLAPRDGRDPTTTAFIGSTADVMSKCREIAQTLVAVSRDSPLPAKAATTRTSASLRPA
jgi:hypothetical protein